MKIICIWSNSTWCSAVSSPWNWCGARSRNTSPDFFRFGGGRPSPWIKNPSVDACWWKMWKYWTMHCIVLARENIWNYKSSETGKEEDKAEEHFGRTSGQLPFQAPPLYSSWGRPPQTQPSKEEFIFVSTITSGYCVIFLQQNPASVFWNGNNPFWLCRFTYQV